MALIQKQVGKSVLAEELNKLTNDALYRYISEEKLEILGNPIPKEDEGMTGSFEQPENFEFSGALLLRIYILMSSIFTILKL